MIPDSGGSTGEPATGSTGPQTLKVDPPAIPGARDAFLHAADEIDKLVGRLAGMEVPAWAEDPVSKVTAVRFESGNGDRGTRAAIEALTKYGDQLRGSGKALQAAYDHYVAVEGTNTAKWKGKQVDEA